MKNPETLATSITIKKSVEKRENFSCATPDTMAKKCVSIKISTPIENRCGLTVSNKP